MKRVYISGPITGTNDFRERFAAVEASLSEKGYLVLNPAKMADVLPEDATHSEYMRISFHLLDLCDTIYLMKNWQNSKGANQEYGYARCKEMEIIEE